MQQTDIYALRSRIATLEYQDTEEDCNLEWTHLQSSPAYLGLVGLTTFIADGTCYQNKPAPESED